MNILILPSWYPTKENPLSGSFFREQALALFKKGHNVIVLNATLNSRKSYLSGSNFKYTKCDDEGLKVYSYVMPSFGMARIKSLYYKVFCYNMYKVFDKIRKDYDRIDIIHAHSFMPAGRAACELGKRHNIPVVVTEHSSGVIKKELSKSELKFLKQTVAKANKFICVSQALMKSVIELTKTNKQIEVVPNLVSSLFNFDYVQNKNDHFTFVAIGNLIECKRFGITITAFSRAFYNSEVRLQIIGDGPLHNTLQLQIDNLKMQGQIQLFGALPRRETADRLKQSNALVLASTFETFGVVYIEALACGKPVIGTKNGGADSIIKPENGVIVDVDDVNQLSEAMIYVYKKRGQFKSEIISRQCLNEYSDSKVADSLIKIYCEVIR